MRLLHFLKNIMTYQHLYKILGNEIDPVFAKRARLILDAMIRKKPKRILDAGCGRGFYLKLASLLDFPAEIAGVDINKDYLTLAQKNCHGDKRVKIKMDSINSLAFPDDYFDFIICSEVLEHVSDDRSALKELHRVLKKGGTMIITVPNRNFPFLWDPLNWTLMKLFNTHVPKHIWWLAGIWADHERLYKQAEFEKLIKSKFTICSSHTLVHWCWPFSHFLLYGIGKNIVERLNAKSFSRFSFEKDRPLTRILAKIFSLPSRFDSRVKSTTAGLFIEALKQ